MLVRIVSMKLTATRRELPQLKDQNRSRKCNVPIVDRVFRHHWHTGIITSRIWNCESCVSLLSVCRNLLHVRDDDLCDLGISDDASSVCVSSRAATRRSDQHSCATVGPSGIQSIMPSSLILQLLS